LDISFGSIGVLRPAELEIFVQSAVHPICGLHFVGGKPATEAPVDTLVKQHPHETVSISRSFASSRKAITCSRVTDGNPAEKVVDCVTGFDVIEQGLHRNPCAIKHCGAAHHLGATADNRLFHGNTLRSNPRGVYVDSGDTSETL
jgi:hypothetical protein